jgi:UDP-glucose 4-epimerase
MRFLVTGGAGFIGSHLVVRLVEQGHHVRVLDNLSTGRRSNLARVRNDIEFIEGDIRDQAMLTAAMQGVSHLLHLAALVSVVQSIETPLQAQAINTDGTLNVLEHARRAGVERVVQASSCAVYGNSEELPLTEQSATRPCSPYALTKLFAEQLGQLYTRLYHLPVVALRFFNVYGPGQDPHSPYAAAIPRFVERIRNDRPVTIYGDGMQSRDFIYVGDIVEVLQHAALSAAGAGEILNAGFGRAYSIRAVVDLLAATLGRVVRVEYAPPREGEVRHSCADVRRLQHVTGFRASTDLAMGLREVVDDKRVLDVAATG